MLVGTTSGLEVADGLLVSMTDDDLDGRVETSCVVGDWDGAGASLLIVW